jgi:hypothetical protein
VPKHYTHGEPKTQITQAFRMEQPQVQ